MPAIEITTAALTSATKKVLACAVSDAVTGLGIPEELVTVIFRPADSGDIAVGRGEFVALQSPDGTPAFARVEVTGGGFDQDTKQRLAADIGGAFIDIGIPERSVSVIYRIVTGADVFIGRGGSPFR